MEALVKLTGIARFAAEGSLVASKRRVEYRTLPTRKLLNRCHSARVPFHWSINPYRGCEYGCKYCYARYTHEFLKRREPEAFETEIYSKDWDETQFRHEMKSVRPGHIIGIGTATDPYQPLERKSRLTRRVLETMRRVQGTSIFITTKSNLVPRDKDLLSELAKSNEVHVTLTVTTMNSSLARVIEPFAPRPDLRMQAVAELTESGIGTGVIANPVLPLITDSEENLESVARAAKAAGADQFGANVLFLQPTAQRVFFSFLGDEFPEYLKRYQSNFASGPYLRGGYPDRIRTMVEGIRRRVGIPARDMASIAVPPVGASQMQLF